MSQSFSDNSKSLKESPQFDKSFNSFSIEGNYNQSVQGSKNSANQIAANSINNSQILNIIASNPSHLAEAFQLLVNQNNQSNSNQESQNNLLIKQGRKLINQGKFRESIEYFLDIKEEIWYQEDNFNIRYLILANIGLANLGLEKLKEASNCFLEALQYNEDDETALALTAIGYEIKGNYEEAEKLVRQVLNKNPGNALAHSTRIRMCPDTLPLQEVEKIVPEHYHDKVEVLAALGNAALDRKNYERAKIWFQQAVDLAEGDTKQLKSALAFSLLKPYSEELYLAQFGQLDPQTKEKIEQAVDLYTDILNNSYPNPEQLSSVELRSLSNRCSALWILNRVDEAIRDIEIVLEVEPGDWQNLRQYARLLFAQGNTELAIAKMREAAGDFQFLDATIDLIIYLLEDNQFQKGESLINELLERDVEEEYKNYAQELKVKLYLKNQSYDLAQQLSNELLKNEPDSINNIVDRIHIILNTTNNREEIRELIDRAQSTDYQDKDPRELYCLAEICTHLEFHQDVADISEKFVDSTLNTELTGRLIYAYYFSGQYKNALDRCEVLLAKYGATPHISDLAAILYFYVGDLDKARNTLQDLLALSLNQIPVESRTVIQLRLAIINYESGHLDDLDAYLKSKPNIKHFRGLKDCLDLIKLYQVRDCFELYLETLYESRKYLYSKNLEVHGYYIFYYNQINSYKQYNPIKKQIDDNCGVLLRDESGKKTWYILEDRSDTDITRQELNAQQPLYQELLGKQPNDEIILEPDRFGFGEKKAAVVYITDKYWAAGKQCFDIVENNPQIEIIKHQKVPRNEEGDYEPEFFEAFDKILDNMSKDFTTAKSVYTQGKLPLGGYAKLIKKTPIEAWEILASNPKPYVHCWSNPHESLDNAVNQLKTNRLLIVDISALLVLFRLNIADEVIKTVGKLGITQSTISLLLKTIEQWQLNEISGYSSIGIEDGVRTAINFAPEYCTQYKEFFESILIWVRNNCQVVPCYEALNIPKQEKQDLDRVLGISSYHSILAAESANFILYSDDQWTRWYSHAKSKTTGVWTQAILIHCLNQRSIDYTKFFDSVINLIRMGYQYTSIDTRMLIEGAKRSKWQLQEPFNTLLTVLENKQTPAPYLCSITTDFIYEIYRQSILNVNRHILINSLLTAIIKNRDYFSLIERLKYHIENKFYFLPIAKHEIFQLIRISSNTQIVV